MIRACIFDMDGTLFDTLTDIANAANHALTQLGFPKHPLQDYKAFIGNGISNIIRSALPEDARGEENATQALELMNQHYVEHCLDFTRPFEGVPTLLMRLRDRGLPLAKKIAATLLPDIPFLAVLGEREGGHIKPDPTDALTCARLAGIAPDQCALIGDSDGDIHTARNAGMISLCVDWGFRSRDFLQSLNPDALVSNTDMLYDAIINHPNHPSSPPIHP